MKLYYLAGACSLASDISLREAGIPFEAIAVERGTKQTADGKDFNSINPKGYVPALVLDDGSVLTENVAVLTYISTLDATGRLAPKLGSMECFRTLEWLAFISSEIHKNFSVLFRPNSSEDAKQAARDLILMRCGFIERSLGGKPFLTGEEFTVADAYLYVTLSWHGRVARCRSSRRSMSAAAAGRPCSRHARGKACRRKRHARLRIILISSALELTPVQVRCSR
jgi:glutathione S-transferase